MAVFTEKDKDSLDYYILRDCPVCLYYYNEQLEQDIGWLESQHYKIHRIDADNKDNFIEQLSDIII